MKLRFLASIVALLLVATAAFADSRATDAIRKARAAIGSESALAALQSIHYKGTLQTTQKVPVDGDPNNLREESVVLGIDIIFQKRFQQRMTLRSDRVIETTALNEYEAWVRQADAANETQWQVTLLDSQQVKRLRANTWENLYFFAGIERRGGTVEYAGEARSDDRDCVKLIFSHGENIVFTRFFDKSTGRLVKTVTESGGEIREEGELIVQGLRFPRKLLNKSADGQLATITFESVTLNEKFPDDVFAVPTLRLAR